MGSDAAESLQVLERCRLQAPHSSNLVPLSLGPPQVLLLLPHLAQWEQLLSEVQHLVWPALE